MQQDWISTEGIPPFIPSLFRLLVYPKEISAFREIPEIGSTLRAPLRGEDGDAQKRVTLQVVAVRKQQATQQESLLDDDTPWLSRNNRAEVDIESDEDLEPDRRETYVEIAKALVESSREDLEGRIFRVVSVSGDTKLRREAVRERRGEPGSYRAKTVAGVMMAFLTWFQRSQDLVIKFPDFEINAPCSYERDAVLKRYGQLCDFERGSLEACRRSGDNLYTSMLSITASHENANGQARCPADFWRQMRESWSGPVRRELQRTFEKMGAERYDPEAPPNKWWEYVRIVEPHKSGYGHHHIAVVTNFEITANDFDSVIAKHVETTPSASEAAHQISGDDPRNSCVSVNRIDPKATDTADVVGNLASYLSGYLSEFSDNGDWIPLMDKPPHELMFLSVSWAMNVRRIDFSNQGHAICRLGEKLRPAEYQPRESDAEVPPPVGISDTRLGKEYPITEPSGVQMVTVDDEPEKDPGKVIGSPTITNSESVATLSCEGRY